MQQGVMELPLLLSSRCLQCCGARRQRLVLLFPSPSSLLWLPNRPVSGQVSGYAVFSLPDVRVERRKCSLSFLISARTGQQDATAAALDRLEVAQQRAEQYGMREEDMRQHCVTEEVLREFLRETQTLNSKPVNPINSNT